MIVLFFFILLSCAYSAIYREVNNITRTNSSFPFNGEVYTGFIPIDNKTNSMLFYHMFAFNETTINASAPVILWLQDCSSLFGSFAEMGPVIVLGTPGNIQLVRNPYTWNKYGHLLLVDQPIGTGFSINRGQVMNSAWDAAQHFSIFMARFYQLFPNLAKEGLYIFGESYGGKWAPVFTYTLLKNTTFSNQVKILGLGVGDGWSDPITQAKTSSTFGIATGLINRKTMDNLKLQEAKVFEETQKQQYWLATNLSNNIDDELCDAAGGINTYDYREYSSDYGEYIDWLNDTDTQKFLGVPPTPYIDCNDEISDNFYNDSA